MEHYDSQMAARVWQRVQSYSIADDPTADILSLLQEEMADLSRYRQLYSALDSSARQDLQQLIKGVQQCILILRGIFFLLTNTRPDTKSSSLPKELPVSALQRCYGATVRRISRYERWCAHQEYGPGFLRLMELCRHHCQLLLHLLGGTRPV